MKLNMYSICDKMTTYIFPFPAYSDEAAARQFAAEIDSTPMSRDNPQDFELFRVGSFDLETGLVEAIVPNVHVRSGLSVSRKVEKSNE